MENLIYLILLVLSLLLCFVLLVYLIRTKNKKQIHKMVMLITFLQVIHCSSLIAQILLQNTSIPPITFEYFAYISGVFFPIALLFIGIVFANTKIQFKKCFLLLFVIPIISLLLLWTNDYHHLFYEVYSTTINTGIVGPYFTIHSAYSYILIFIGLFFLLKYSIKNSGFFSRQSILILLGSLIPVVVNLLGTFDIVNMTIYLTPICFTFTILIYSIAIFKFKFLSVAPIALQRIVDRMSDSYIVLNEDNVIIDFNEPFLSTFKQNSSIRNNNFFELLKKQNSFSIDLEVLSDTIAKAKITPKTQHLEKHFSNIDKYFNIEISSILSNGNYLGTLILLKDITQHITDMKTIEANQDLLVEKERLASLGQMIGGIAHNLKTPIMSIAGASQGIIDLVNEYRSSIGDPEVTIEDHKEIANDMENWVRKIQTHAEYMSDVITAVKGQAVALSNNDTSSFTIDELLKYTSVLMKHELNSAIINLNIINNVDSSLALHGNINSLVQVINNMISNSIQAYNGKQNESIDLIINKEGNNVILSIKDYGSGMSKDVKDKLFKQMITTKGKNGTGLGLFMSYSNIRAHFNGNITFESEEGKGTIFNIIIPVEG